MNRVLRTALIALPLLASAAHACWSSPVGGPLASVAYEENVGQALPGVRFVGRAPGSTVAVLDDGFLIARGSDGPVRFTFEGALPWPCIEGSGELPGHANYLIGRDPAQWRTGVRRYAEVRFEELYPGVDLLLHGSPAGEIEYDLLLKPGARIEDVVVHADGALEVTEIGQGLRIGTPAGEWRSLPTVVFQEARGGGEGLRCRYVLRGGGSFGFEVEGGEPGLPLVIDPVLSHATYLGGDERDMGGAVAVDTTGATYVAGATHSTNFPVQAPYQASNLGNLNGNNVFVTKFDPTGQSLVYSTYIGGSVSDGAFAIAVDAAGNAFVAGSTRSPDFPLKGPIRASLGGPQDGFVLKLSPDGSSLAHSTYLGGETPVDPNGATDVANAIAVDAQGNAYVAGKTSSSDFPALNAIQPSYRGGSADGFVSEILPDGSGFVFSTYLGGGDEDNASGLAVAGGDVFVTGSTRSADFPIVGGFQAQPAGKTDGFVVRLAAGGGGPVYSSYFGGTGDDIGYAILVDGVGTALVAGYTLSPDLPLANPLQPYRGLGDAFAFGVSPDGSTLPFSTYLGGAAGDAARGAALDSSGRLWIVGFTSSQDFPTVGAFQGVNRLGDPFGDTFIAQMETTPPKLLFSTFLGGDGSDEARSVAVAPDGSVAVCGLTTSTDFPDVCPFQPAYGGGPWWGDAFLARLDGPGPHPVADGAVVCSSATVTLDASLSSGCVGYLYRWLDGANPVCNWSSTPTCDVTPAVTTTYTLEVACAGAPSCVVGLPVVVTVLFDVLPGDLGNRLYAVRSGGDVMLSWGTDPNAATYSLYRGVAKGTWPPAPLVAGLAAAAATLPDIPSPEALYFYRVAGASCSGAEGP